MAKLNLTDLLERARAQPQWKKTIQTLNSIPQPQKIPASMYQDPSKTEAATAKIFALPNNEVQAMQANSHAPPLGRVRLKDALAFYNTKNNLGIPFKSYLHAPIEDPGVISDTQSKSESSARHLQFENAVAPNDVPPSPSRPVGSMMEVGDLDHVYQGPEKDDRPLDHEPPVAYDSLTEQERSLINPKRVVRITKDNVFRPIAEKYEQFRKEKTKDIYEWKEIEGYTQNLLKNREQARAQDAYLSLLLENSPEGQTRKSEIHRLVDQHDFSQTPSILISKSSKENRNSDSNSGPDASQKAKNRSEKLKYLEIISDRYSISKSPKASGLEPLLVSAPMSIENEMSLMRKLGVFTSPEEPVLDVHDSQNNESLSYLDMLKAKAIDIDPEDLLLAQQALDSFERDVNTMLPRQTAFSAPRNGQSSVQRRSISIPTKEFILHAMEWNGLQFYLRTHPEKRTVLNMPLFSDLTGTEQLERLILKDPPSTLSGSVNDSRSVQMYESNVTILGLSNAGKSTIINTLIGASLISVSSKINTTKSSDVLAILNYTNKHDQLKKGIPEQTLKQYQVILRDNPGFLAENRAKKFKIPQSINDAGFGTICESNVVVYLVDASLPNFSRPLDSRLVEQMRAHNLIPSNEDLAGKPISKNEYYGLERLFNGMDEACSDLGANEPRPKIVLVMNKVDLVGKRSALLDKVRNIMSASERYRFDKVFFASGSTGQGLEDFRQYLLETAAEVDGLEHPKNYTSNLTSHRAILELAKEAVFESYENELPYVVYPVLDTMTFDSEQSVLGLEMGMETRPPSRLKAVCGPGNRKLAKLGDLIEDKIFRTYGLSSKVHLIPRAPSSKTVANTDVSFY